MVGLTSNAIYLPVTVKKMQLNVNQKGSGSRNTHNTSMHSRKL